MTFIIEYMKARFAPIVQSVSQFVLTNAKYGWLLGALTIPPWERVLSEQGTTEYAMWVIARGLCLVVQIAVLVVYLKHPKAVKF